MQSINFGFKSTVQYFCFYFGQIWGLFWAFWGYFWGQGSGSKTFLRPAYIDNQLCFGSTAICCVFILTTFGASFAPFWALQGYIFGPLGLLLWSGSKTFFKPTYVDNQLQFWKYCPIFSFSIRPNLGPIWTFSAFRGFFWVQGQVQKLFGTYLQRLTTFILEVQLYLASLKLSRWGGGGLDISI